MTDLTTPAAPDQRLLRGAGSRNFRLYFIGQGTSTAGMWMRTVALSWLILDRTDSGLAVGLAVALQYLPLMLLGTWVGVLADRSDKRLVLGFSQVIGFASAAGLATVELTHVAPLWPVYALVAVGGFSQAFDMPVRQAFLSEVVEPIDLTAAVGLISATQQVSRVLGPLVAGVVIATVGTGACFVVNALSFLGLMGALLLMDRSQLHPSEPVVRDEGQIREGFAYMWRTPVLRGCLTVISVVGLFALNNQTLLPLFARETFGGSATQYSWMVSAMGAGALGGSVFIARRRMITGRFFVGCGVAFGLAMIVTACAPGIQLFLVLLLFCGAGQTMMLTSGQVLLQLSTEPSMIGRVMAAWMLGLVGTTPIGGPFMGEIASAVSPRVAYGGAGLVSLLAVVVCRRRLLDAIPDVDRSARYAVERPVAAAAGSVIGSLAPDASG